MNNQKDDIEREFENKLTNLRSSHGNEILLHKENLMKVTIISQNAISDKEQIAENYQNLEGKYQDLQEDFKQLLKECDMLKNELEYETSNAQRWQNNNFGVTNIDKTKNQYENRIKECERLLTQIREENGFSTVKGILLSMQPCRKQVISARRWLASSTFCWSTAESPWRP